MVFAKIAGKTRSHEELKDKIFEVAGKKDIFLLGDSLHHTPDPNAYIDKAWDQINPGGYLVVSEPFRFKNDEVTKEALNPLDSTPFQGSMQTLDGHQSWINRLKTQGGQVVSAKMVPGTIAGLNDVYHRVFVVIQKPVENKNMEQGEWKFIDHCPEFHDFLNPIYKKLNKKYELNFPEDVPESDFKQLSEQLALMLSTQLEPTIPFVFRKYIQQDRWNGHQSFNFLENYISGILENNLGQLWRLERLIIPADENSKLLDLLKTLREFIAKLQSQNSDEQIQGYFLQTLDNFLKEKGIPRINRDTEGYLIETFFQSRMAEGPEIAKIKVRVFANVFALSLQAQVLETSAHLGATIHNCDAALQII